MRRLLAALLHQLGDRLYTPDVMDLVPESGWVVHPGPEWQPRGAGIGDQP